jgi:hypothetical protein
MSSLLYQLSYDLSYVIVTPSGKVYITRYSGIIKEESGAMYS